jgi:hypothetical protein
MSPTTGFIIDPIIPKVLEELSGVDALILNFYNDAGLKKSESSRPKTASVSVTYSEEFKDYRDFLELRGHEIIDLFGLEIVSSSISNLLRLGLFFVEGRFDDSTSLVKVGLDRNLEAHVDASELKDELSSIYYHLNLAADNVDDHMVIHHYVSGTKPVFFLPYDMTRLAKRLLKACSPQWQSDEK